MRARSGESSPYFADMLAFLRGGAAARELAQEVAAYVADQRPPRAVVSLADVKLLSPVPRPESLRDCMSFEQHIINSIRVAGLKKLGPMDEWIERRFGRHCSLAYRLNKGWYERPIYYKGNRFSVIGPETDVVMPPYTQKFDYELEWGVYIGQTGRDIPRNQAHHYIGGYTIFNDFSARDIQMKEQGGRLGPAKGKDFDGGNAIGPYLVTPDEVPDPYNLTMTATINDEEWSRGSTADMHWTFADMIAYISQAETLYPGEFIGSGTCSGAAGRGCGMEMGRYLQAGDVVALSVMGLGTLRNRVIRASQITSGKPDNIWQAR
ncbi:MAG: fumarylacetoacetate hydrolase family protein [Candidatus Promineifilaceae bacterium]